MAAKTTVKVALTNNAAKDDLFTGDTAGYDWLSEDGSLSGNLNVLGNDPGSAKLLGVSDTIPTTSTPSSMTQATDTISVDAFGQPLPAGGTIKLTANADGTVGFDASALYGKLGYLAEGETVSVTFYYTAQMANGTYSVAKVTIQITGDNDAPTVQSVEKTIQDTASTDDFGNVTGKLVGADGDHNAVLTYGLAAGEDGISDFGTLTVDTNGNYTFVPDDAAINALKTDQDVTFNVKVTDEHGAEGTATVTIHLKGVNDTASISGGHTGDVTEDSSTQEASGTLAVSDVDTGDAKFATVADADLEGDYGTFTFDEATGEWTYTLDNDAANHLADGATDTDTLTVTSLDGTDTETITVTIHGANDDATIAGDNDGSLTEDSGSYLESGTLTIDDPDDGEEAFATVADADLEGDYGTFTFDEATGEWTYTLDNDAANHLADGATDTDTLTVTSLDGTDTETITVTIHGANDDATISGDNEGSLTEDSGSYLESGTLSVADPDDGEEAFATVADADLEGDYGTFTFDEATGEWTYTLDNDAANHLADGATDTDTLTVTSLDGTDTETITVTIHGANDAAQFTGEDTGEVTEDGDLTTGGTLSVDDDDDGEANFDSTSTLTGDHGTFVFDLSTGEWTYALNNNDPALDDLDAADTPLTDTLTVYSTDGSSHDIVVTINGADEAPVGPPAAPPVNNGADPNDFDLAGPATGSINTTTGNDTAVIGTASADTISAKQGNDTVYGRGGDDNIDGDQGTDTLYGQTGNDTVNGNNDADVIYGGSGNDIISGGNGTDTIYGGSGSDTITGNNDADTIIGGYGADVLTGAGGNDIFKYLSASDTGDTITDFKANGDADKIDLSALYGGTLGFVAADSGNAVVANSVTWTEFGGNTVVSVDFTGDTTADLQITLTGTGLGLTSSDFVL